MWEQGRAEFEGTLESLRVENRELARRGREDKDRARREREKRMEEIRDVRKQMVRRDKM